MSATVIESRALRLAGEPWEFVTPRVPDTLLRGVALHIRFDDAVKADTSKSFEVTYYSSDDGVRWREEFGCSWTGNSVPQLLRAAERACIWMRPIKYMQRDARQRLHGRLIKVVVIPSSDMMLDALMEAV